MAHQRRDVDGRACGLEPVEKLAETPPAPVEVGADTLRQVSELRCTRRVGRQRRNRKPAQPDQLRRDPLGDRVRRTWIGGQGVVGMRVHVDEARREHQASGVNDNRSSERGRVWSNSDDTLATHRDVLLHARRARSVHYRRPAKQHIHRPSW